MTICERIFELIEEKNLKAADLAKILNIKQSVLTNWKKRNTNPPIEYALVICEFLGVSIQYLITGKDGTELTLEEQKLLEAYRSAAPAMQEAARKILDVPELPGKSSTSEPGKQII